MPGGTGFDPFNNRLSRDLRNGLSEALLAALEKHDPGKVEAAGAHFRQNHDLSQAQNDYLEDRLACYRAILARSLTGISRDGVALLFWDHELFFEFHELLEKRWMQAEGSEKEILQGLIRAAGTFVHRRSGNTAGAAKMAERARATIKKYPDALPPGFVAEPLLAALNDPTAPPPRFGALDGSVHRCHHSPITR